MPLFGQPNVEKLATNRDVQGLVRALDHKNPQVRKDAARALGELASFFNIPQIDPLNKTAEWPLTWPGKLSQTINLHWITDPLDADEAMIGSPLQARMQFKRVTPFAGGVKVIEGTREDRLISGMRSRSLAPWDPSTVWNILALVLTDHRFIVVSSKLPPPKAVALNHCAWKARAYFSR
ncbi:MAG: armadillo/beta-catenin-like repeat-containing protein [Chloroflexi bacterium]|nr:armadillo/beta-catenin-like repeat-containing protein [Chloroflexota bacterium]